MFLNVYDVKKSYGEGQGKTEVLKGVSLTVEEGEVCVLLGSSGCGKSTLLNCIGGLDHVDSGTIEVGGMTVSGASAKALERYRREQLGFVFQSYQLIPNLTVEENIELCRYLSPNPLKLEPLIKTLGLSDLKKKFPANLSGGQQQRVAIARAVIKNPKLLLCDEPTGALDSVSAREILRLLETVNHMYGTTVFLITHNLAIPPMANKVLSMCDGIITQTEQNPTRVPVEKLEGL